MFGLSAAQRYGGIYVPPHIAVIHQVCVFDGPAAVKILARQSHSLWRAVNHLAVGEGGGELVKQLLNDTVLLIIPM